MDIFIGWFLASKIDFESTDFKIKIALSALVFGQKSCFLGPIILKIPQPNWYQIYVRTLARGLLTCGKFLLAVNRSLLQLSYSLLLYD